MKVLMINAIYGSRSSGRSMHDLTEYLRSKGHSVDIVSPQKSFPDAQFHSMGNVLDHKWHAFCSRLFGKPAYYSKRATKKLVKLIDGIEPDIIHIQVLHGNFVHFNLLMKEIAKRNIPVTFVLDDCWLFTGKCAHYTSAKCYKWKTGCQNCPQVKEMMTSWFLDRTKLLYADKKKAYENLNKYAVVAVSDWLLHEAEQSIMKNATIMRRIYNSIDMEVFKPRQSKLKNKWDLDDKFVILAVAVEFHESKGLSLFFELSKKIPSHWRIVFVGGVPSDIKLPENILSVGFTENTIELAEYYSMADVFVQMSLEETFGKVTAEALSSGTPAVVFNSTANPELIGEGCGYVVEPKNVDKMFESLKKIEENGKQYYSKRCREFIRENMDKEKVLQSFLDVYEELLKD